MKIEQIYTGCLAQGAYYIESEGEVAIIDPLREVQQYIDKAQAANANIKYIFETHFHADFVSGHLTLSEKTGAPIIYGPTAEPAFKAHIAKDGEIFKLGKISIIALHTPGHTMESTTYLLRDENGKDHAIFSGDTLFLGDVGRPDLAQKAADMTQEQLATTLYHSLRTKIMPLADEVIVYPAHGAGSACGKNLSKETVGTLGEQKRTNYALRADMTVDEFVKEVTDGLLPPPLYFPENVRLNKNGYEAIDTIIEKNKPLTAAEFKQAAEDALILDVRDADSFGKAHIPGAIFIGIDGGFAPWVGALITDINQPIVLVTPEGREKETITRLSRVGYDNTLGYLAGGIDSWIAAGFEIDSIQRITATELETLMNNGEEAVIDVRKPGEYSSAHIANVPNLPLDFINDHVADFPSQKTTYLHCAGGYRSMIAASILKARGFHNMIDVIGGFGQIKNTSLPIVTQECENSCSTK
ncbi:MAG: rhodanese-like domain-containing protein [Myroides sp.]|nr:rhodanese-like domain-containing protein [Myroides sp.]